MRLQTDAVRTCVVSSFCWLTELPSICVEGDWGDEGGAKQQKSHRPFIAVQAACIAACSCAKKQAEENDIRENVVVPPRFGG